MSFQTSILFQFICAVSNVLVNVNGLLASTQFGTYEIKHCHLLIATTNYFFGGKIRVETRTQPNRTEMPIRPKVTRRLYIVY